MGRLAERFCQAVQGPPALEAADGVIQQVHVTLLRAVADAVTVDTYPGLISSRTGSCGRAAGWVVSIPPSRVGLRHERECGRAPDP
ncbi:hypothetical protein GCM10012320_30640 [Sinomonas cellulolyticus]|nr:hypothetical protein GCM10012320_30640 [Sinomonas sp. KCTC 49339]